MYLYKPIKTIDKRINKLSIRKSIPSSPVFSKMLSVLIPSTTNRAMKHLSSPPRHLLPTNTICSIIQFILIISGICTPTYQVSASGPAFNQIKVEKDYSLFIHFWLSNESSLSSILNFSGSAQVWLAEVIDFFGRPFIDCRQLWACTSLRFL